MPQNKISQPAVIIEPVKQENPVSGQSEAAELIEKDVQIYYECSNCAAEITEAENGYSQKMYGRSLCRTCQALAKNGEI